jgi:tRNA threonylcarbamoyladenosine biosynthesis protein TsaE
MEYEIKSLKDTEKVARNLSKQISFDEVILLDGELGAGKTTFVKFLAKHLKFNENDVSSPSFTIVQQYLSKEGKQIYHIDLFRIEEVSELYSLGLEEILSGKGLVVVEWYKIAEKIFRNSGRKIIVIKFLLNKNRKIIIENLTNCSR